MSDVDFEEELLGLIDEPSKRASSSKSGDKQRSGSSKRRKAADTDDSGSDEGEPEVESEEDDEGVVRHASSRSAGTSYPLEGMFRDEKDKAHIYSLPEVEREGILAEREAEKQKAAEKHALDAMYNTQKGNAGPSAAGDSVAGAAKRKHTKTGETSTRKSKLQELTKRRTEKSNKASKSKKRSASPGRSSSSSGGESSDDDEHQRRDIESTLRAEKEAEEAENITMADVQGATLRRAHLMQMLDSPWFEEFVTGSYVRVAAPPLPGKTEGGYLVCEVIGVTETQKPYQVDPAFPHVRDNRRLTLKHGSMERAQPMTLVSSGDIENGEFGRWMNVCFKNKIKVPQKSQLVKKRAEWDAIKRRVMTDADITANLKRKKESGLTRSPFQEQQIALNRRRGEYNMLLKRQDWDEADKVAASIAELEEALERSRPASGTLTPAAAADEAKAAAALGGDAIWRMKERNKEVLRQALEAAKREAALAGADKPRKKVKLDAAGSSQQISTQPDAEMHDVDSDDLSPGCSAARGIPLPQWKVDRFGFGKVTSKLALDLGEGF